MIRKPIDDRDAKRRRSDNDAKTTPPSAHRDLEEKTRDNGYGYPSSEEDDDALSLHRRRDQRVRNFRKNKEKTAKENAMLPTPRGWKGLHNVIAGDAENTNLKSGATQQQQQCQRPQTDVSKSSRFTLSSAKKVNNAKHNPYSNAKSSYSHSTRNLSTRNESSSASAAPTVKSQRKSSTHIVCSISENLARETCVATLDASRPTTLNITKQGNGQTYAETLALLRMLSPHEILLNEGRKNSLLASKVGRLFGMELQDGVVEFGANRNNKRNSRKAKTQHVDDLSTSIDPTTAQPHENTIVKFIPRYYFDQTKGADLLRKLSRPETYNATLVEEYILLSSSYAVLQYAQLCLGAGLTRHSLALDVNAGGSHRMNIDRATMTNLELLVNAKTGKTQNSLVGSIDCTKTSVGGKLLRTNLMAPPTRLDTIHARLDLVDAFLEDEEFFYVVMEHLEDLPDVDKMLSCVALVPRGGSSTNNGALFGNGDGRGVTARVASRGISALVCIKSTLSVIPSFAHVLEVQLKEMDAREGTARTTERGGDEEGKRSKNSPPDCQQQPDISGHDDESTTVVESERSEAADSLSETDSMTDRNDASMTKGSSLDIGLGTSTSSTNKQYNRILSTSQTRHQLLRAILIAMKQPALSRVLNAVTNIFTESTTYSKNSHAMRHQECFALKPNTDGMMDVLRKAFLANVDDIYRLADEYAETYDITVQVKETTARGYYLSVSADLGLDLPEIFIQPVRNGRFIHCTTEEVYSLNSRAQENVQDLLLMTHERIQEALKVARENYDCLASLSDAIALLDMCHCFADNVASSRMPWCRPQLSDCDRQYEDENESFGGGGAIAIRNGRYAIDVGSGACSPSEFVPNDTYSSSLQNFTVITGINGSGKSTYLKQIALIVILAHCGSYVPAEEAFLPIRDQVCTRIGTADDQEHNISTFLMEMKETAFICNSTTEKSLFLLDELGRATSNEDGVAVAWSVSEFLLTKKAMTFFVTHYPQISKLASVYSNVQNQHLGAHISSSHNQDGSNINYTHKILPGPCTASGDYGVEMSVSCGFPNDVIQNARKIRRVVQQKMPGGDLCENTNSDSLNQNNAENRPNAHDILCDLAKHLTALKETDGRLSNDAKRVFLQVSSFHS
eukprot:CCRYP_016393-RB/>CCRYP_016393-RB protein AED:0.23 eAED:0.23 QI:109/1/1/1/0.6/0.5/6/1021/1134